MPPARGTPATVELPRGVLIALCAALAVTLLLVAFLLGRATAPPAPVPAQATLPEAAPAAPAPAVAEAPEPAPRLTAPPENLAVESPSPGTSQPAPPVDPNERAAVARYFAQLDRLETSAKAWGDPQQLAMQLMQQSAQGDQRAFDELLSTERRASESLRALSVPPACREHHREALALMDEAVGLLGRLSQAMASQDLTALQGFVSTAQELETRTKHLDALGASLKRQYGVPTTPSAVAVPRG